MITMPKRFGMFIHWGAYAVLGWQEQARMRLGIGRKEYAEKVSVFDPQKYDPEKWVLLAKEAGMEYICFTAKHHDGFCMWNTAETEFNSVKTCGRDLLAELSKACQKHGMALSIYYSIPDWNRHDGYNPLSSHQCDPEDGDVPDNISYRQYVKAQVRELLSNYGPIYTWFWDIPPKIYDPSLNELVRSLMPGILINDRGYSEGDFSTPERSIPDGESFERHTEACDSVGVHSWAYRINEDYHTQAYLTQSIDKILLMGGSYLLNVGPDADGIIPEKAVELVRKCGLWYNSVKEAFSEGAQPCNEFSSDIFWAAKKDNIYYIHIKNLDCTGISLAPINKLPKSVTMLNTGESIDFSVETYPADYTGKYGICNPPHLRLRNINVIENGCPMVIRIEF